MVNKIATSYAFFRTIDSVSPCFRAFTSEVIILKLRNKTKNTTKVKGKYV